MEYNFNNSTFFDKQNTIGKTGEQAVYKYLCRKYDKVIDVSANSQYQKIDTDFLCDDTILCEVKTDQLIYKTNNIFLEDTIELWNGTVKNGWYRLTKADYLYIYDNHSSIIYGYRMDDIRQYVEHNRNSGNIKFTQTRFKADNNSKISNCFYFNKDLVKHDIYYYF